MADQESEGMGQMQVKKQVHPLLNPEMLVGLSAVVIGVCALIVSILQMNLMQEQQRMSVWPRLEILYSNSRQDSVGRFEISIHNKGIGPALIDALEINIDNQPIGQWDDLKKFAPQLDMYNTAMASVNNRTLLPGEEVKLLTITTDSSGLATMLTITSRMDMQICYASVYQEHWMVTRKQNQGQSITAYEETTSCNIPEERHFAR